MKKATLIFSAGVAAKTENPQSAEITSKNLKSLAGGRVLNSTDLHSSVEKLCDFIWKKKTFLIIELFKWADEKSFQMWNYTINGKIQQKT